MEGLTKEYLFKTLLAWYANPPHWKPPAFGSNISKKSVMERDGGRAARTALLEITAGNLLKAVCDAYGIPLMELGRRAGLPDPRMGEIVRGSDGLRSNESNWLRKYLDVMIKEQNGR